MDSVVERKKLIKASSRALVELNKLIIQEIDLDELDPEKAKAAAQGKIEAIKGYSEILGIIAEQEIMIENESDTEEGKGKATSFAGVETRAR